MLYGRIRQCFFQVLDVLNLGFAFHNNVINVDFHGSVNQELEDFHH